MEAKDTVKAYGELKTHLADIGIYEPLEQDLRMAQAEISFKAGIKEVVEWVAYSDEGGKNRAITFPLKDWQAQVKDWGL